MSSDSQRACCLSVDQDACQHVDRVMSNNWWIVQPILERGVAKLRKVCQMCMWWSNALPRKNCLANTAIPCRKLTKYRYCIYDWSRLLKVVSISYVCLSQACIRQKSTSAIARKQRYSGTVIKKPRHWMCYQFYYRVTVMKLCNHLALSLKSSKY